MGRSTSFSSVLGGNAYASNYCHANFSIKKVTIL